MAFGQETIEQLYRELAGGRHLSVKLQALLEHPLDSRGQEEAAAVSRELERLFMVSLYMLKSCSNSSPEEVITKTAPEKRTDSSIFLHSPTKVKRIRSEEVHLRNGREEVVTRTEVTPSPYKDGFLWRKYGQKNIQDSNYLRLYYKCTFSRERRCAAKKQVQQRDDGEPPMFLVTYLNEHTCQAQPVPGQPGTPTTAGSSRTTTRSQLRQSSSPELVLDSTMNGAGGLFGRHLLLPHVVGGRGSTEEDAAIVTCLATVIRGGAGAGTSPPTPSLSWPTPAAPEASRPSGIVPVEPAAFLPPGGHSPSADGSVADEAAAQMDIDYRFQYDPLTFSPVEAAADHRLLIGDCDVPRAARIMDTVWPQYTSDTSAWHR